jgi:hypothetical protein
MEELKPESASRMQYLAFVARIWNAIELGRAGGNKIVNRPIRSNKSPGINTVKPAHL